jgi:crotonobetainyl-CoA:carnitine CoA-transferase CaiB-like acyl-CoA transferase
MMLFECADQKWLHLSYMSGLAPRRSVDEVIELEGAPEPLAAFSLPVAERAEWERKRRARCLEWDRDELVDAFRAANHAAEAVGTAGEILRHPQTIANGTAVVVDDPDRGPTTQMGVPIHLLGTPGEVQGPQPRAGEHTDEVLGEAGYAPEEIAALRASGAVA